MNRTVISTIFVAALSATIAAQSRGTMSNDHQMSQTSNMDKTGAKTTYVGCLQSGSAPGTFILRGANPMMLRGVNPMMKKSAPGATAVDGMSHDTTAMTTRMLTAMSVDLRKHIGHKVSVTGSSEHAAERALGNNESTFAVKTLKVVAASCS